MAEPDRAWGLVGRAWRLAARCRGTFWGVVAIGALLGLLIDLFVPAEAVPGAYGAASLIILYLQLLLTARAMAALGLLPPQWDARRPTMGRYPLAFGVALLSSAGILIGLVLLVVPGILLAMRWSVALPVLLAEDVGAVDSLQRSSSLTRGHWRGPLQYAAVTGVAYILPAALAGLTYPARGTAPLAAAVPVSLLYAVLPPLAWLTAVELYRQLKGPGVTAPSAAP